MLGGGTESQVPRRNKSSPAVAAGGGTRADDVARMQGVVNDMMAGLSPTPRFHRPSSLVGMARQQLDDQVRLGSSHISLMLVF